MNRGTVLDQDARQSVLQWAVKRQVALTVSVLAEGRWSTLRSQLIRFDPGQGVLQIAYPLSCAAKAAVEIAPGDELGISFRRGHKKCLFVSPVVLRRADTTAEGEPVDTLVLRVPDQMRELQRRAYQRVEAPSDNFIAVKVWQGGAPSEGGASWPICAGRLSNMSMGGLLVDIRADQNPRLGVGDLVGVEITASPGRRPLVADAQYRHCTLIAEGRIGIGLQFLGLEHNLPGRSTIMEIAEFVRSLQREGLRPRRVGRA